MNIKSLLLGSAAALVAVTGARAADVIVPVAPEPTDYVRVCDVYGSGFFYLPGTETCMKIGGYVRFKYIVNGDQAFDNDEGDNYDSFSRVRVRLNFDVREETELGTLRAFARLQAENTGSNDDDFEMEQGYIQLGGLTMGYLDSLWVEGSGLLTDTDSIVGDIDVNRISYTYAADGFSAALSLEDDDTGDFAPNVVGRLAYEGGWGSIFLAGSYDENGFGARSFGDLIVDGSDADDDDGGFALKAGASLKDLIATDSEFKVEGSYAFDPSSYSTIGLFSGDVDGADFAFDFDGDGVIDDIDGFSFNDDVPVEWQAGAGYAQAFGKLGVAVSGLYGETFDFTGFNPFTGTFDSFDGGEYYRFVGNVGYEITNNFDVLAEVSYTNIDFGGDEVDQTAGFLQFVRSF
ncbi:MAG: porin [Aurantimonas endophytica]|uniref:Porin n=1 Tax=Aurantimonas endophytica TaxID=1522175 RepID=A0A7W6MQS4_9HYPH|nr:porin [Aurantimonas endophytica]MBB4004277.1 hypothetical protein [Aurantimonas endophytica]MCO6405117.1 porin [Aurantimonas endophytica]